MKIQKIYKKILSYICIIILGIGLFGQNIPVFTETVYAETLTGKINADLVNVRVGAGTGNDYIRTAAGKKIQLNTNQEVTILGSANASDGSMWYNVSFYYGGTVYTGFVHSQYVTVSNKIQYVEDEDFEKYLNAQGFPDSYKDGLRQLHAQYPKWIFVADHINYDWEEVVANESLVGRNLIENSSISSWKSTEPSAYNYTTGTWYGFDGLAWVAASKEIIKYCLDPRNFLDSSTIFQFEKLAYDADMHTLEGINSIMTSTFMENNSISNDAGGTVTYAEALLGTAQITGVSPYHLTSRIIQEMGINGTSKSISGTVSGYQNLYNYYNQGAYAHDGRSAIVNGLIYARSKGWNTRLKAIVGGAEYIGKTYINIGQNTLYYEKFDFVGTPYTHQYMTNILAPSSESFNVAKGYTEEMRKNLSLVFVIPVYKNMPATAVAKPTGDGSPNNVLKELSVNGYSLTPTFSTFVYDYDLIVDENIEKVTISAQTLDPKANVTGTGEIALNPGENNVKINVTAVNGDVRTYDITIYRGDVKVIIDGPIYEPTLPPGPMQYEIFTDYKLDDVNKYITGINPDLDSADVLSKITVGEGKAYILNADGTVNSGKVATGDQLVCVNDAGEVMKQFTVIVYGDVDGDGTIGSMDMLYVKRHILGYKALENEYLLAADADHGNDGITAMDMLYLKRHILAIKSIEQ